MKLHTLLSTALSTLALTAGTARAETPEPAAPPREAPAPMPRASAGGADGAAKPAGKADPDEGPLGPVRLGVLAGIGAPSALTGQLLATYMGWVGVSGDYGSLPTVVLPIASGVNLRQSQISVAGRVYPFHGAVFVGCGVGTQEVEAWGGESASIHAGGATTTLDGALKMSARTVFVMPQVGFLYRFEMGLAVGMDAGVQLPLSGSGSTTATANGTSAEVPSGVRDVVAFVQTKPTPVLNLLRIGYVL